MKLNPLDIKRQQFAKAFRGYEPAEVDSFLKQLADQWESALDENRLANEKLTEMENKLRHYERVEMALQEALETARETGRRSEAMAEQKAKLILDEAEMRAQQILQDAERDRYGMRQDLVKLTSRQAEIGARLRGFLLSELEILAQFQGDDPVGFIKLQPAWPNGAPEAQTGAFGSAPEAPRLSQASETASAPVEPTPEMPAAAPAYETSAYEAPEAPAPASPAQFETRLPEPPAASATPEPSAEPAPLPSDLSGQTYEEAFGTSQPEPPRAAPSPASDVLPPFGAPRTPEAPAWAPETPPAAPTWNLRSLVTGEGDNVAGTEAERERIRRILEDMD